MLVSVVEEISSSVSLTDPSELNSSGVSSSKLKLSNPFDGEMLPSSVSIEWSETVDNSFSTDFVSSSTAVVPAVSS